MKKYLFVAVLAFASVMAYAQPRAIGGKVGAFDGVSYEHSLGENSMVEIELGWGANSHVNGTTIYSYSGTTDIYNWSFYGSTLQLAATYDWIDPFNAKFPWDKKGEWHWYLGVGAVTGYGWLDDASFYKNGQYFDHAVVNNWGFIGAAGRAGVEYDFWFPLQLSIDYRPSLGAGFGTNPYYYSSGYASIGKPSQAGCYWDLLGLSLGVRYKFK